MLMMAVANHQFQKAADADSDRRKNDIRKRLIDAFADDCSVRHDENGVPTPRKKRRKSLYNWQLARSNIYLNYYSPVPIFGDQEFTRVFRITRGMADELLNELGNCSAFFRESRHPKTAQLQIDPKAKLLIVLKVLAYGTAPMAFLDFFQMGDKTAHKAIKTFCKCVHRSEYLRSLYLRSMSRADAKRVSAMHEEQYGVAGMVGSIDCMHGFWKNCPMGWRGHYTGKDKKPSLVLEAAADANLFIWHAAFGYPGSLNDINILEQSPLHKSMLDGSYHRDIDFEYSVSNHKFFRLYYLADGIYPECSRFVKTFSEPIGLAKKRYASWQEGARKDIERTFGVLQRKFHVLCRPFEQWKIEDISDIVYTTIILHNWMVTIRVGNGDNEDEDFYEPSPTESLANQPDEGGIDRELDELNKENELYAQMEQLLETTDAPNPAIVAKVVARKNEFKQSMTRIAHERWCGLYDVEEHTRLRDAIMSVVSPPT
jgi:hypothetical protein